jgi:NAD(P)-dependent dehydrogenase (short-subunit alcohol dehydrogenase family)
VSRFAGRTAVVTGAASGIGRALAWELAVRGATLAISDVDEAGLGDTAERARQIGATVRCDRLDVTDRDAVLGYANTFDGVHLLINNAGIALHSLLNNDTPEEFEQAYYAQTTGSPTGDAANEKTA